VGRLLALPTLLGEDAAWCASLQRARPTGERGKDVASRKRSSAVSRDVLALVNGR